MRRLHLIFAIAFALVSATAISLTSGRIEGSDTTACVTTVFKTELYKQACQKGGQKAAKDVAKKFMKDAKIKSCNQCHSKLAPDYARKPDALEQFHKAGGK